MDEELIRLLNMANTTLADFYRTQDPIDEALATLSGAQLLRYMENQDKKIKREEEQRAAPR
jgi:hypothetical protein